MTVKVIILFDGLDGKHREYELSDALSKKLANGEIVRVEFCDPKNGNEVFEATAL